MISPVKKVNCIFLSFDLNPHANYLERIQSERSEERQLLILKMPNLSPEGQQCNTLKSRGLIRTAKYKCSCAVKLFFISLKPSSDIGTTAGPVDKLTIITKSFATN